MTHHFPALKTFMAASILTVGLAAAPAQAESAAEARAKLEALSDAQIFEEMSALIRGNSGDCSLLLGSRDAQKQFEAEFEALIFDRAGVSAARRADVEDDLHDRIDDLMEVRLGAGEIVVNQEGDGVAVTLRDC